MKNFVSKLTLALLLSVVLCVTITAFTKMMHISAWTQFIAYFAGWAITAGIIYLFKISKNYRIVAALALIPACINIPAHNWLFYSADEVVTYADVNELSKPGNNALYFDLENYYYNTDGMGSVEVVTTRKKRGVNVSEKTEIYSVVPLLADSVGNQVKAWMMFNMPSKDYQEIEYAEDLLRLDDILCFELVTEELEDYISASTYSDFEESEGVIFIKPLYKEFTTSSEWRSLFLMSLAGGLVIMALIGLIMDKIATKANRTTEMALEAEEAEAVEK